MLGRHLSHIETTASPRCILTAVQRPHHMHHRVHEAGVGGALPGRQAVCPAAFKQAGLRSSQAGRARHTVVRASENDSNGSPKQESTPFGYTRKDVIVLGVGILGFGYALYYGLQAAGYDALVAGNIVQIFVFLGIGVGYISTYIFRVANKEMTYVKQLEDYEEAVMQKRLEEMPQAERERILAEIEQQKQGNGQQGKR